MNWLDWILLLIVAVSVIAAAAKGFVYEVLMIAATVVAIILGVWKYGALARHLSWIHLAPARDFLAFVLIVIGVLLLAAILARVARALVRAAGLRWFDRLLGAALGLVRGSVLCVALLVMLAVFPFDFAALRQSSLAPDFLLAGQAMAALLPAPLHRQFRDSLQRLRQADVTVGVTPSGRHGSLLTPPSR